MKLGELIKNIKDAVLSGNPEIEISQLEYDSRMIGEGALFFAIKGFKEDGYEYVSQAKGNGAVAVLGEREICPEIDNHVTVPDARAAMAEVSAAFYGYPGERIKACGVTGTNGKTTTCYLIKSILEARNKTVGMITSEVCDTGNEIFASVRTTPESLDIQRLLFLMKGNHCVNVVVEVSSHALELKRVDIISFRVAVYTNLTQDHLDFHGTMENYIRAKGKLLQKLEGELSYAVINFDVEEFRPLFGELNCSFISYSVDDNKADIYCTAYDLKPDGTTFDLVTPMGNRTVHFKLPGRFNLQNALAAIGGGLASGVDIDNVVKGLESANGVPGRLESIDCGQPFTLLVDFAHTPDALQRVIEGIKELTEGRILLLFGCGGDRDRGKRPLMGKIAIENSDVVIVTSDNPRSEDMNVIIEEIKTGMTGGQFSVEPDRKAAIERILKEAIPGDIVLLAGKGAENSQEIKGELIPFDDREVARSILAEMGYKTDKVGEEN